MRDFGGAIVTHNAAYGYFVTTSTFTSGALDEKRSYERIRTIDGLEIERLLQTRSREIAEAYDDILQRIQTEM
jgi:restriction endonuclease Mrr